MTTSTFIAGKGVLYQADARAKLLALILLCVLVFLPISTFGIWIIFGFAWVFACRATGLKQALQPFKSILFMLIIMAVFAPMTYREGSVALKFGSHMILTYEALENLSVLIARFLSITYLCTLYVWTTPMADINLALRWYGLSYRAALVLTLAFRFVPFIADSFTMIQDSHALRTSAVYAGKKPWRQRMSDAVPTVTAALVFALKSIPYLAMSLEHRGLGRAQKRTSFRHLPARGGFLFTQLLVSVMIPTVLWVLFTI